MTDYIVFNEAIRSFLDGFVRAVEKIGEEIGSGKAKRQPLPTLQLFLDATAKGLKAQWAGVMQQERGQWVTLSRTDDWPSLFPVPILLPLLDELYESRKPNTVGEDDWEEDSELSSYLVEHGIKNLAIIPFTCPIAPEEGLLLIIGNKRERIIKGDDELPYYLTPILRYLAGFFSSIMVGLKNRREVWQSSLFDGSRKAIYERGCDLLQACGKGLEGQALDKVKASAIDADTLREILPHPRPAFQEKSGTSLEGLMDSGSAWGPLTELSSLRQEIWKEYTTPTSGKGLELDKALHRIKRVWKDHYRNYAFEPVPPPPKFSGIVLDQNLTKHLWDFAHRRHYRLECLRTHLFFLHYLAASLEGVADNAEIDKCDRIFRAQVFGIQSLTGALRLLLWEFLDLWAEKGEDNGIQISSEWLILWFAHRILHSEDWLLHLQKLYTPNARAQFYARFSTYFLYVLFLMRYCGEPNLFRFSDVPGGYESFVDASLFLLAEYCHQMEGLPTKIPLYRIMTGHVWANEAILYTVQDNYRDHHHHVWNVCLLGMVLIDSGLMTRLDPGWDTEAKNFGQRRRRNWILAVLHDIGYGLNLTHHMLEHLKFLRGAPCLTHFLDQLKQEYDRNAQELCARLDDWIDFGAVRDRLDHGVVSALYVLFLDTARAKPGEPVMPAAAWQRDIREAFVAIAKHNLEDTKISPRNDPLALLLVLCDHLQEWDRPHLEAVSLRRSLSTSLQRPGQVTAAAKTIVHKLQTNLRWKSGRVHLPTGQALRLSLWYKDAGVDHFEPALIWCQNTFEFQRIDFEDWPVDLEIDLKAIHPRQKLSGGIQLWEMDLFEDFARSDEECASIMAWFKSARDGTTGLSYQREDNPKDGPRETFSWTLKSGGFLPSRRNPDGTASTIEKFPAGLYRRYTLWKEQRLREIRLRKR